MSNLYFRAHPTESDREYLLHVFCTVASLPVAGQLFDERHNPLWSFDPEILSGDSATRLLGLWQRIDPDSGALAHDFTDPAWDTRFLGDLYQDLSESARKRYALLQTPEFVEEFILDRTLTPAIEEFGFREVRLIDPACGSGHFLLGAFRRLDALWARHEPGTNPRERASRVLLQVAAVDLNPFAAAIARFRLCVAALRASEVRRLADAPAFELRVAAGDTLRHGPRPGLAGARQEYLESVAKDPLGHVYRTEDAEALRAILGRRYHVVVGNPPYITPKDRALNQGYRERFGSCHRKYSLAVPFTERFFDLAHAPAPGAAEPAGFVGMIKALLNNLESRLRAYGALVGRRVDLWHGDVGASRRRAIMRERPDLLLTTPESMEVMLVSRRSEPSALFRDLQAVVVDELHAFAGDDRGWHLLAVLERVQRLTGREIQRLGLSATIGNPEALLEWLAPAADRPRRGSPTESSSP